jgi:hypothetical protein
MKIHRTTIFPVVLYGCETWSLTLREKRRLRMYENRVLRRVYWPKRDEVTGEWRELHNEELNDLYSSPNIVRVINSRRIRWAGHVARTGGEERRIQGFFYSLSRPPSSKCGRRIMSMKNSNDTIGYQTRAFRLVAQCPQKPIGTDWISPTPYMNV